MSGIFRREAALGSRVRHQPSLAELFHENTKLRRIAAIDALADVPYDVREVEAMARAYKRYRLHPSIALPPPEPTDRSLVDVMASRRTRRSFGSDALSLADLSAVLQWSYGITGEMVLPGGGTQHVRAAPSAGALYPAEIYLGVRDVEGLDPGLYHYEVPEASLAHLVRGDLTDRLAPICCGQEYARQAGVIVLISAMFERTIRKYGNRGYRYVLLDIGHLAENICLACTALDLSIVTTCGFFEDEAAQLLGIDGHDEGVVYVAFIGKSDES